MAFTPLTPEQSQNLKPLQSTPSRYESLLEEAYQRRGSVQGSRLADLAKLFAPEGLSAGEQKEKRETETSITGGFSKINEIRSLLGKYQGEDIAGIGPWLKAKLFKGISPSSGILKGLAPSEGINTLQAAISDYNTRLFEIAGKAFTGPERSLLEGFVLDIGDDEERIKDKMDQAEKMIELRANNLGMKLPKVSQGLGLPSSWIPD